MIDATEITPMGAAYCARTGVHRGWRWRFPSLDTTKPRSPSST